MPTRIDRGEVERLVGKGTRLIDVLPAEEYAEDHLPGAISLPLRQLEQDAGDLDPGQAVIVYCWDAG